MGIQLAQETKFPQSEDISRIEMTTGKTIIYLLCVDALDRRLLEMNLNGRVTGR